MAPIAALSRLIATESIEEFVASPIGKCVVRPTFVVWCLAPDLQGAIIWGRLDESSIREMMAVAKHTDHPDVARRRRVLVDCTGVERVDADVLLGFTTLARERVSAWTAGLEKQAIVVPPGLGGILLAGALPSLGVAHPLRFAQDMETALAFIDHPAARGTHEAAVELATAARGRSALLFKLRGQLARALTSSTVDSVATALGMSVRTLQRELGRLGTSFSDELRSVRIGAAEALLVHSDLKIDAIATQVGFGTASRMTATLRRELSATASAIRARARGSTAA